MGDSDLQPAGIGQDIIRSIFSFLDRPAYWLCGIMYELFFNVASAELFSNATIMKFYGRVQLILGVFMMFKLAMIILKGIIEPEGFFGGKKGDSSAGSFITKVITGLVILTMIMPISIPNASNEYEKQINNNGLLFGTLYSLQHRILSNNTLGRLILGNDDSSESISSGDDLKKSSRMFISAIIKGFYRINLLPEDKRPKHEDGKDDAVFNENRVCQDISDEALKKYTALDADPTDIINMVNLTCDVDEGKNVVQSIVSIFSPKLAGTAYYVFSYKGFISMIVPIIFAFILLSFTVDVAVRAIKLSVLRLIAPVPIISYMDPKGSKDSAFNSWVKSLTSTYLDLFIRLGCVYFAIFLIQDMIRNGVVIEHGSGIIGGLSLIIIWIGIFIFAKQAPKFIKDVLGLKSEPGKLFGGFGEVGAALGLGAAAVGAVGSGIASARASRLSDKTRQAFGENVNPNSGLNRAKHIAAGIAGGIGGFGTGVKATMGAKDHAFKASLDAMNKRNAADIARGNSGSSLLGRIGSNASSVFRGEGSSGPLDREISSLKSEQAAFDAIKKRVSGEMVKKDNIYGHLGATVKDSAGHSIDSGAKLFNYKDFMARYEKARATNQSEFEIVDKNGSSFTIDLAEAERQKGFLLKNNENAYYEHAVTHAGYDVELEDIIRDANAKGANVVAQTSNIKDKSGNVVGTFQDYRTQYTTNGSERLGQEIRAKERDNVIAKANDQFSGKK